MSVEFETELVSALLRWLTAAGGAGVPPRRGSKKFRVSAYARKGFAGLLYGTAEATVLCGTLGETKN